MSQQRIYSASTLAPASISFSNLRWMYGTGISIAKGQGRNKEYNYRNGVMTELGDIEESVWYKLIEQLIKDAGEQWLFEALLQWEREHNYVKAPAGDLRKQALHAHANRIFDDPDWVCFLPFNKRFRPEVYEQANIITIVNECCGIPGEVTQEQIDRSFDGTVCCPHCSRWSSFSICPATDGED